MFEHAGRSSCRRTSGILMAQVRAGSSRRETRSEPAGVRGRIAPLFIVIAGVCALVLLAALLGRGPRAPGSAAGGGDVGSPGPTTAAPVDFTAFLYPEASAAPGIALVDSADRPFTLTSLRGDLVLVFFGYTHCPDVCPADGRHGRGGDARIRPGVRAVFVTVDPERDTTASLAEYEPVSARRVHCPYRQPGPGYPRHRRGLGCEVRTGRDWRGERLLHVTHGGRLRRGRQGSPARALPLRDGGSRDDRDHAAGRDHGLPTGLVAIRLDGPVGDLDALGPGAPTRDRVVVRLGRGPQPWSSASSARVGV